MPATTQFLTHLTSLLGSGSQPIVSAHSPTHASIAFHAEPGIYQLSAIADGSTFDYESLYLPMDRFGNKGQRTGPWDFDLRNANRPLVPSFWVELDGQPLGLWYFARISLQDLAGKLFSGKTSFAIIAPGSHTLTLRAYHPNPLPWLSATLGLRPESPIKPVLISQKTFPLPPAALWATPSFWDGIRSSLTTTKAWLAPHLPEAFAYAKSSPTHLNLPLLVAHARLHHDPDALQQAIGVLQTLVDKPHWGNPDPAGYGHNGDHPAAEQAHACAWSLHALSDILPPDLRAKIIDKLSLQLQRFIAVALLNEDYWGGSVLQDHGWRTYFTLADATLHMLHHVPGAHAAFDFAMDRVSAAMNAMPRDGVIPWSSYGLPYLYLDAPARLRHTLLALTGQDLYDQAPWHAIIPFMADTLDRTGTKLLFRAGNQDDSPLIGAAAFCFQLATKHADSTAHALGRLAATRPAPAKFYCSPQKLCYFLSRLDALLAPEPLTSPTAIPAKATASRFSHYPDSGLAQWRLSGSDAAFLVKAGPFAGWHADRLAAGPCDRMQIVPDAGHFALLIDNQPFFCSPEHGYRLHTNIRSCLLINNHGQLGDIGYPMSIPSFIHPGHGIQTATPGATAKDASTLILDLTRAYPAEAGVLHYTRAFLLGPGRTLQIIDQLTTQSAVALSWLFQTRDELSPRLSSTHELHLTSPVTRLILTPEFSGGTIASSLQPTDIVWSYDSASGHAPCSHARYDITPQTRHITARFHLAW